MITASASHAELSTEGPASLGRFAHVAPGGWPADAVLAAMDSITAPDKRAQHSWFRRVVAAWVAATRATPPFCVVILVVASVA
jgi:hypothetical protein